MTFSNDYDTLYIGGEWVRPDGGEVQEIINPATEAVIGKAPVGGVGEVDQAIGCAREAFDNGPWARMDPKERAAVLQRYHDAILARRDEVVNLIVTEAGSTVGLANAMHFDMSMNGFQYFINQIQKRDFVQPASISLHPNWMGGKTLASYVKVHEPMGVVAGITAYNFPFFLNIAKIGPALAAGCTLVLKPSPFTPLQALILGRIADEAGLPRGVLSIVTGGVEVGEALTTDPRVDQVSFTGSDKVGALIKAQAAPTLKRVALELGGKSALVVCEDADVQAAAMAGYGNVTVQAGQGCVLQTRHLVHNSIREEYVQHIRNLAGQAVMGDPADPSVSMGPLINAQQRDKVMSYIESGRDEGARLLTGGGVPSKLDKGFFVEPTFFDNLDNSYRIAREEIFGPVGVVIGFDTEEEAIAIANDSAYGLGGGVFSADPGRAFEIAMQMRTGGVSINGGGGILNPEVPFGGYKRSGIGREYSYEGLDEYLETKVIDFRAA